MRTAIYPGSFDPVTVGHIDIIKRAANLFDKVIVLVSVNPVKPASFTKEERIDFLERSVCGLKLNVEIDGNEGLLIDYFKSKNADVIIKGLRAMSDFEYEFQMALTNKDMCHEAETVFISADATGTFLSSSMVRQIAMFGGDISHYVPKGIVEDIMERMRIK